MRRTAWPIPACLALALALVPAVVRADPPGLKTLSIGAPAPDFDLPGVDGKNHSLAEYSDAKVLVVLFTCNHCPTAQAYEERVKKLYADYKDRGVALVAISPNDAEAVRLDELGYTDLGDSLEDMKVRAKDQEFEFPYLYDGAEQEASLAYGALATPHVFIFDEDRKLRYNGRIDDAEVKTPKSHDARNAIDALLAGEPVPVETTRVFGCSTKWSDKRESAREALARWDREEATLETADAAGLETLLKSPGNKKYRLVNFWATWCGPCVQEMPELVTMHRMYRQRDFEMVLISLDEPDARDKALEVLNEHHASTRNVLFTGEHDDLARIVDPEWPGPIPHTVLLAPDGKVLYRKNGSIDPLEVRRAIADHIGRTY